MEKGWKRMLGRNHQIRNGTGCLHPPDDAVELRALQRLSES